LNDLEQVHGLRITVKRLRYDLELADRCLHAATFAEVYPRVERLQDQLGRLNDRREAAERLEQILSQGDPEAPSPPRTEGKGGRRPPRGAGPAGPPAHRRAMPPAARPGARAVPRVLAADRVQDAGGGPRGSSLAPGRRRPRSWEGARPSGRGAGEP